jgi:hypothetical protein
MISERSSALLPTLNADFLLPFHPDFANRAAPLETAPRRSAERDEDDGLKAAA